MMNLVQALSTGNASKLLTCVKGCIGACLTLMLYLFQRLFKLKKKLFGRVWQMQYLSHCAR